MLRAWIWEPRQLKNWCGYIDPNLLSPPGADDTTGGSVAPFSISWGLLLRDSTSLWLFFFSRHSTLPFIYLFFKFIYFIYFWLCWVFVAVCGLSLVVESGGYSSLQCVGFSLRWLLFLRSTVSRHVGFSSCGMRAE